MARTARLCLDTPIDPPLHGSMGVMGHYFHRALRELGYEVELSIVADQPPALQMLPVPAAQSVAALRSVRREEVRLFFDRVIHDVAPERAAGVTNIVFFHGLRYAPGVFLPGDAIAGMCANSDYLRRVLLGLLLFPALAPGAADRTTFAFRGDAIIGSVPLVLPATDNPDGYLSVGEDLPDWARAELEADCWFGHALRPRKLIPEATAAIVHALNREPHRALLGKPVRLFVSDVDRPAIAEASRRLFGRDEVADWILPVPWIKNTDLVELMRRTHFALMVDWFPEPFGLYPLESVLHGSPVYTTGAGNLRHLLPPGHGIRVIEPAIARDPTETYADAARTIAEGLASGVDAEACAAGRDFIGRHHTAGEFIRGLGDFLGRVERGAEMPPVDPDALTIDASPMVRVVDRGAGVLLTDVGELRMQAGQLDVMERATGARLLPLLRELDDAGVEALRSLFAAGAISLGGDLPSTCRIALGPS